MLFDLNILEQPFYDDKIVDILRTKLSSYVSRKIAKYAYTNKFSDMFDGYNILYVLNRGTGWGDGAGHIGEKVLIYKFMVKNYKELYYRLIEIDSFSRIFPIFTNIVYEVIMENKLYEKLDRLRDIDWKEYSERNERDIETIDCFYSDLFTEYTEEHELYSVIDYISYFIDKKYGYIKILEIIEKESNILITKGDDPILKYLMTNFSDAVDINRDDDDGYFIGLSGNEIYYRNIPIQ